MFPVVPRIAPLNAAHGSQRDPFHHSMLWTGGPSKQDGDKGSEVSKGKQARMSREAMRRQIGGLRRKIQCAADVLWPHYQESSVQARSDFKLPLNGPFNH